MNCTRVNGFKDAIQAQGVEEIVGNALLVAGEFDVLQACDLFNLNDCVLAEVRYGGERDEEVIRAAPHVPRSLIYLAVEDDHLAIESFKCAEAKVTVFQKSRGQDGTRIDTFDEGSRSRNLVNATRARLQV